MILLRKDVYDEIMKKFKKEIEYYDTVAKKFERKYSCSLDELESRIGKIEVFVDNYEI